MPSEKRVHWWVKLPVLQKHFSLADHIPVDMPSLPSMLVCDFLLSKYYIHTRLKTCYDSLQYGVLTSWHSRLFFAQHQGAFVQLGVAFPILHITTNLQMFLLPCGHGLPAFCLNSLFVCASVSRQFSFKHVIQAIPHFIMYLTMICSSSWSLRDSSLSQLSCNDTSCLCPVQSDSSSNRQIILIIIFEGLNNSLSLFKQDPVSWWHDFLWFFLSPMRLLVHTVYSVCYSTVYVKCSSFYICFSKRLCKKYDGVHTLVIFVQYFRAVFK